MGRFTIILKSNKFLKKRYRFKSNSDTEIILASYDFWGEGCLRNLMVCGH